MSSNIYGQLEVITQGSSNGAILDNLSVGYVPYAESSDLKLVDSPIWINGTETFVFSDFVVADDTNTYNYLLIDRSNKQFWMGDSNISNNGTYLEVDDSDQLADGSGTATVVVQTITVTVQQLTQQIAQANARIAAAQAQVKQLQDQLNAINALVTPATPPTPAPAV